MNRLTGQNLQPFLPVIGTMNAVPLVVFADEDLIVLLGLLPSLILPLV